MNQSQKEQDKQLHQYNVERKKREAMLEKCELAAVKQEVERLRAIIKESHDIEMLLALCKRNKRLRKGLHRLEWLPEKAMDGSQQEFCPVCRASKKRGHYIHHIGGKEDCWLAILLNEEKK